MPRGRAATYDQQREAILAHAAHLFAKKGYSATSMNEVAEACGVSKPTLYHYVRDKYQLLVLIAEEHVARLEALVGEVESLGLAPRERLRQLVERFVAEYAHAQPQHRVLTEDVRFLDDADRARILAIERRVVAAFARAIAEVRGETRPLGLDKPLAMLLFGMINWMFTWLRPGGRLTHADMAPLVADLFLDGLGAVQAPASRRAASRERRRAAATPLAD
jgi:TetR/AcrR family transcriptional regulator